MYLRTVRAKGAEGVELEYIRLVEAYWENGRSKQRIVANLGRKDLLAPHLESLIELLGGGKASSATCAERVEATLAACWGPMLVARWLWRELGLENILDGWRAILSVDVMARGFWLPGSSRVAYG